MLADGLGISSVPDMIFLEQGTGWEGSGQISRRGCCRKDFSRRSRAREPESASSMVWPSWSKIGATLRPYSSS